MFVAVFVRRLREGKTYEVFLEAWYPDKGFGFGGRGPITARSLDDDCELLTVGLRRSTSNSTSSTSRTTSPSRPDGRSPSCVR